MIEYHLPEEIDIITSILVSPKVRNIEFDGDTYYALSDVMSILTGLDEHSAIKDYISKIKKRDKYLSKNWNDIVKLAPMQTNGGTQNTKCVNIRAVLRIVQSVQTPKAEKIKNAIAEFVAKHISENVPLPRQKTLGL